MSDEKIRIFDPPFGGYAPEENPDKARAMAEAEAPAMNQALHSEALGRELGNETITKYHGQSWRRKALELGHKAGKAYDDSHQSNS